MGPATAFILTTAQRSRGRGHVMRMLALGEQLLARGFAVSIPSLADDVQVSTLALSRGDFSVEPMERPDVVILDDYEADLDVERRWMATDAVVVAVDDAPTRRHDCHLLVDQNDVFERHEDAYRSQVPESARLLLGPRFAMLGRSIRHAREARRRSGEIRRVVVNWGAIDRPELTALVRRVLAGRDLEVRVITSRDQVMDMAEHWLWADLAIGAAGSSSWERVCLGLPAIVFAVASNQVAIGETLHDAQLASYAGPLSNVSERSVADVLEKILGADLAAWSRRCIAAVDGRGSERVADAICLASEWRR